MRQAEGTHQREGRTLHKEERMGTSNKNECLRDNSNLEVDDRVKLLVVVVDMKRWRIEVDVELSLEEVRLKDNNDESNPTQIN